MMCLQRNMVPFMFAPLLEVYEKKDDYGNYTGEHVRRFGTPIMCKGNITGARGFADVNGWGMDINYDKTICMSYVPEGLDETSYLWIDDLTADEPDYHVIRIDKGLQFVLIACAKTDVSR